MEARDFKFVTTAWTVVNTAQSELHQESSPAMEILCQTYWFPLYGYIRQRGYDPAKAQDLTQAFFERFLQKDFVLAADRSRGRFRSFMLTALKHFLADNWDREQAVKRGGGSSWISLEADEAEARLCRDLHDDGSPERLFDRRWAAAVLEGAQIRLRAEFIQAGREKLGELLCLDQTSYVDVAEQCEMTVTAVKAAAHRFRLRYQELIREEIGRTVSTRAEIDDEIRYLLNLVSGV